MCSTSVALAYLNTMIIDFKIFGVPYALDYTMYVRSAVCLNFCHDYDYDYDYGKTF